MNIFNRLFNKSKTPKTGKTREDAAQPDNNAGKKQYQHQQILLRINSKKKPQEKQDGQIEAENCRIIVQPVWKWLLEQTEM